MPRIILPKVLRQQMVRTKFQRLKSIHVRRVLQRCHLPLSKKETPNSKKLSFQIRFSDHQPGEKLNAPSKNGKRKKIKRIRLHEIRGLPPLENGLI